MWPAHRHGRRRRHHRPQTDEADVINTEQQMAEAKQELKEEMEADAELLGVKRKAPAAAADGGGAAAGEAGSGGEGGADEEMVGFGGLGGI
jgi:hypothetical protein